MCCCCAEGKQHLLKVCMASKFEHRAMETYMTPSTIWSIVVTPILLQAMLMPEQ
jgi:hypothetical protein